MLIKIVLIMSGLLSHSKNSIPVWFRLFWWAGELHALSYALLLLADSYHYSQEPITSIELCMRFQNPTNFKISP